MKPTKKKCDKCGIPRNELYRRGNQYLCGKCCRGIGKLSSNKNLKNERKSI